MLPTLCCARSGTQPNNQLKKYIYISNPYDFKMSLIVYWLSFSGPLTEIVRKLMAKRWVQRNFWALLSYVDAVKTKKYIAHCLRKSRALVSKACREIVPSARTPKKHIAGKGCKHARANTTIFWKHGLVKPASFRFNMNRLSTPFFNFRLKTTLSTFIFPWK